MRSAMTYLGLLDSLPPDAAPALAVLRDRVAQAAAAEVRTIASAAAVACMSAHRGAGHEEWQACDVPYVAFAFNACCACIPAVHLKHSCDVQMPEIAQANVPPFEYVDVPVSAQGGAAQQEQHTAAAAAGQYDGYGQGQYAGSVASQPQGYGSSAASQYGGYTAPAAPQYAAPTPQPAAPTAPATYNQSIYDPAGNYGKNRQTYLGSYPSAEPKAAYAGPPQQQPPALQPQHSGYSTAPVPRQQFVPQAPAPAPPQPYHPAAPPAPTSPYAQHAGAPSHPHSPGAGARPQQFAPEPPQQPPRAPAVFQPMHAAAPRPAAPPQQMQAPPQTQTPPAPPAPPPGPPPDCTVYNVDTSNVTSQALPIVQNLMGLFQVPSMPAHSLVAVTNSLQSASQPSSPGMCS